MAAHKIASMSASPLYFPEGSQAATPRDGADAPLSELVTASRQRDALFRLSEQLHRASTTDALYAASLEAIEAAIGCDRASILLFDDAGVMQFVAWHQLSDAYRAAVTGHSPWQRGDVNAMPIPIEDVTLAELDPALKSVITREGIRAAAFFPLVSDAGVIGKFMAYFREPRSLSREDLNVASIIARQLVFAIQRQRATAQLAAELEAARQLQELSVEIAHEVDVTRLYEKIMDAARTIMRSDFASMQEYHAQRGPSGEMKLLTFRGFDPDTARFWQWVGANSACSCGLAYRALQRVVVPDVEKCAPMNGTADLQNYKSAGIRSVQSTPLLSRTGQLVGMLSTHWATPHEPSERDLRLIDVLARLAADLIERKTQHEDLRRREERARTLTLLLTDVPWQARSDGAFESLQHAWENYTGQTWEAHAGHGWFDAIHADDRDATRTAWAAACFESRPFEHCARIWNAPRGQYRHCRIRATPIRAEDGTLREWVGACTDIDPQRAVR
jgi:PAS domain S-box-containing protein